MHNPNQRFNQEYACYPVSFLGRDDLENGMRIICLVDRSLLGIRIGQPSQIMSLRHWSFPWPWSIVLLFVEKYHAIIMMEQLLFLHISSSWLCPSVQKKSGPPPGNKIILPPSALDTLARLNISYPMLFEVG